MEMACKKSNNKKTKKTNLNAGVTYKYDHQTMIGFSLFTLAGNGLWSIADMLGGLHRIHAHVPLSEIIWMFWGGRTGSKGMMLSVD